MNLSLYSGKRIALVMEVQGREVMLRGTTSLRNDTANGHVLKVAVTECQEAAIGSPIFLISEARWKDHIVSGFAFGCDYLLDLSNSTVAAQ